MPRRKSLGKVQHPLLPDVSGVGMEKRTEEGHEGSNTGLPPEDVTVTNQPSTEVVEDGEAPQEEGGTAQSESVQAKPNTEEQQSVSHENLLDNAEDLNEMSRGSNELYLTSLPSHDAQGNEGVVPPEDTG